MKLNPFSLFLSISVAGCGGGAAAPTADGADAIVGGHADTTHTAVGMVGSTRARTKTVDFGCTGTLIAARTVLTAAHCVRSDKNRRIAATRLRFALEDTVYEAERVVSAPHYAPGSDADWDDIALIVLRRAPSVEPIPYAREAPSASLPTLVIGYGVTAASAPHRGTGAGKRRSVSVELSEIADREISYDSSERGACYGDSGGPLVQDTGEGEVVVGVTSRGTQVLCDGTDIATRVDAFASWIAGVAE